MLGGLAGLKLSADDESKRYPAGSLPLTDKPVHVPKAANDGTSYDLRDPEPGPRPDPGPAFGELDLMDEAEPAAAPPPAAKADAPAAPAARKPKLMKRPDDDFKLDLAESVAPPRRETEDGEDVDGAPVAPAKAKAKAKKKTTVSRAATGGGSGGLDLAEVDEPEPDPVDEGEPEAAGEVWDDSIPADEEWGDAGPTSRDVDTERHVRGLAAYGHVGGALLLVMTFALLAFYSKLTALVQMEDGDAWVFKLGIGLYFVVGGGLIASGQFLWRYQNWARVSMLVLILGFCGFQLVSSLTAGNMFVIGPGFFMYAAAMYWTYQLLTSEHAAALCTEAYRAVVAEEADTPIPWHTSPYFIAPTIFSVLCIGCLIAAFTFLAGMLGLAQQGLDEQGLMIDPETGELVQIDNGGAGGPLWMPGFRPAISPDGNYLLIATEDGGIQVHDIGEGTQVAGWKSPIPLAQIERLAIAAGAGDTVVISTTEGSLGFYDTESGAERDTFFLDEPANLLDFNPEGTRVLVARRDRWFQVRDAGSGESILKGVTSGDDISGVSWSADGETLAVAFGTKIEVWKGSSKVVDIEPLGGGKVTSLALSPDGALVAGGTKDDNKAYLWSATDGSVVKTLSEHDRSSIRVAFSPDGKRLVSADRGSKLRVYDVASGAEKHVIGTGDLGPLQGLILSRNGKLIATRHENVVATWDAETGKASETFDYHPADVVDLRFVPDGVHLVSVDASHYALLWDTRTNDAVQEWPEAKDGGGGGGGDDE